MQALERGGCVVIFPEGISFHDSHINELRTGAARIALGVAAHTSGRVRPRMVPCGLNYSNPRRFRSRVLLNYGPGLHITDAMIETFRVRPGDAVRDLTAAMADALRAVCLGGVLAVRPACSPRRR
jgi:1-acyl-sn-glycerol-3-phosphate acyltransferase